MDSHVKEYYKESKGDVPNPGTFHTVIPLHDREGLSWEEATALLPELTRGWYELCQLNCEDRIEFTKEFWMSKLPYHPKLAPFLTKFFGQLDDVGVFLTQKSFEGPFEAHLIYSLSNNSGFYQGLLPITGDELAELTQSVPGIIFPQDYIAFLEIHNGFGRPSDTGLVPVNRLAMLATQLRDFIEQGEPILTSLGEVVDPSKLIPFYESYGMLSFQCFWEDWYPDQEMGNVYVSEKTRTISDTENLASASDTMAFVTFIDWLMFYLEKVA